MNQISSKMEKNGRVTIPLAVRRAAGLEGGGDIVLDVRDGEIRVRSVRHAMGEARALTRKLLKGAKVSSDDLIAERRAAAKLEP